MKATTIMPIIHRVSFLLEVIFGLVDVAADADASLDRASITTSVSPDIDIENANSWI